ncbi:uncharacterized protein LOC122042081 [Zingiber officinale]|uniref:uncharacterized protein LOC122042081 n=1 Tax=Zingiber officinale TaxID=94328 RepID=UPI001C4B69F8|nr:uncharacterized protein LOC122042081 [Zingiber officinale]XP_042457952.1 uncharacterized protein LOC122042081 [Zingiber officinale]XP_042457953.1 uncharacterized protein LOC122042081 [Zingiber officinale]
MIDFEIVQKKTKHANNDEISLVEVKIFYSISHGQLDYTSCPPLGAKEDRYKDFVDFHRSCSKCSYKLCLGCCGKIVEGSASQAPTIDSSKAGKRERAKKYVISELVGKRKRLSMGEQPDNSSLSTVASDNKESHWSSISCPPKESGGVGLMIPSVLWKRLHLAAIILSLHTPPMVHLLSSKTKRWVILVLVC